MNIENNLNTKYMKNAIYMRIPRCGSSSMAGLCKKFKNIKVFGGRDMGFWGCDTILEKNTSLKLYECILNHVGEKVYNESFVFTTVRNPYSRAVSMFKHQSWDRWSGRKQDSVVKNSKTFRDFCMAIKNNNFPNDAAKWHSGTLTDHMVDGNDLKVDFAIKLENFQEDFNIVCDKIGIPKEQLPHARKGKHKHYTEYYDEETKQIVAEKYAKDIEYFGYKYGE